MPTISDAKKEKISEHIIGHLFSITPEASYTADIAKEVARDEEFIKAILLNLEKQRLVVRVTKNAQGIEYGRRIRWRLSNRAFEAYQKAQHR